MKLIESGYSTTVSNNYHKLFLQQGLLNCSSSQKAMGSVLSKLSDKNKNNNSKLFHFFRMMMKELVEMSFPLC